ncbi:hypothetical protein CAPTEDRAFT_202252 [Capitella teleta]|uniref:EGF-like domain-containing protein n=1 Tax=Capitella teleta TaxID=283909 RepID=R7V0B5_CAPTE|nr:hypothetical protein CAPTEDRAFT_202252 [Capitella teleta]|eukprot:ELU09642.1 hypothetical protein CAPTEDRAFT_202252 [Capitella teleta]
MPGGSSSNTYSFASLDLATKFDLCLTSALSLWAPFKDVRIRRDHIHNCFMTLDSSDLLRVCINTDSAFAHASLRSLALVGSPNERLASYDDRRGRDLSSQRYQTVTPDLSEPAETPPNPCEPNPCMNGGRCSTAEAQNPGDYECMCHTRNGPALGGKHCEIKDPCNTLPCPPGTSRCYPATRNDKGRNCYDQDWQTMPE